MSIDLARKYLLAGIALAALPAHAAQIVYFLAPIAGGSSLPPGAAAYHYTYEASSAPSPNQELAFEFATFGVDCAYLGPGTPGVQNFVINEFDANGNFLKVIASGAKIESGLPEPSHFAPGGLGLLIAGGPRAIRRRRPETAA